MLPSLIVDEKDVKWDLLDKIWDIVDCRDSKQIYARNGIKNIPMFVYCLKIILSDTYYNYPVSKIIDELKKNRKFKKFLKINDEIPTASQVYEFMSRYSDEQITNIVNNILNYINRPNKRTKNTYIVDATPVACNINHVKEICLS